MDCTQHDLQLLQLSDTVSLRQLMNSQEPTVLYKVGDKAEWGHICRLLCNHVQGLSGLHGEIRGLHNEIWGLWPLVDFITEHSFSNYIRVFQAAPCLHKFAGCFWNFFNITSYRK